jgi:hypothetical protein
LNSVGSKSGEDGLVVRAEYRRFFRQMFQELRAAEDDAHRLNMLLSWMRQPNSALERGWLSHSLQGWAQKLGACFIEIGPYKFAVVPYPTKEWVESAELSGFPPKK